MARPAPARPATLPAAHHIGPTSPLPPGTVPSPRTVNVPSRVIYDPRWHIHGLRWAVTARSNPRVDDPRVPIPDNSPRSRKTGARLEGSRERRLNSAPRTARHRPGARPGPTHWKFRHHTITPDPPKLDTTPDLPALGAPRAHPPPKPLAHAQQRLRRNTPA